VFEWSPAEFVDFDFAKMADAKEPPKESVCAALDAALISSNDLDMLVVNRVAHRLPICYFEVLFR
jgi:hypothetical protein